MSVSTTTAKALRSTRLSLEALEDRTVPAVLDLGIANASAAVNNVIFQQATPDANAPADEFLRINSTKKVEQGYNSRFAPQFDEVNARTRTVRMNDLVPVTANGVVYRVIQLNTNERNGPNPRISLDELRIYVANNNDVQGYSNATKRLGGLDAVWSLGDNYVRLDPRLSGGREAADMLVYIPQNLLTAGGNSNPFVYLYSKFGVNIANNGGNERWGPAVGVVPPPPPPPGSDDGSLAGNVFRDYDNNGIKDGDDYGLEGVRIVLFLKNGSNEYVEVAFTHTDAAGEYSFGTLAAGTYAIQEEQPFGFNSGTNTVGVIDGMMNGMHDDELGDRFFEIALAANKVGTGYNFAEFLEEAPS